MKLRTLASGALLFVLPGSSATAQTDPVEVAQLLPTDVLIEHRFGYDVAISGEFAMVGAPEDDGVGGIKSGTVRVYRRQGGEWEEFDILEPAGPFDNFGTAIAMSGDWAIISAPETDSEHNDARGSVYFYHRDGGEWALAQELAPPEDTDQYRFGRDVAISGDTAMVVANGNADEGIPNAVHVYRRNGGAWAEVTKLTSPDDEAIGVCVAVSGDFAMVGDPADDEQNHDNGAVNCYRRIDGEWVEDGKVFAETTDIDVDFGHSVAMDGDVAVVGAPVDEGNSGAAYVFRREGDEWVREARLRPDSLDENAEFGFSAGIFENLIVVGATNWGPVENVGAAYLFRYAGGSWVEQPILRPSQTESDGMFGFAVGTNGAQIIVGCSHILGSQNGGDPTYIFDIQDGDGALMLEEFKIKRGELMAGGTHRLGPSDDRRMSVQAEFAPGDDPPYLMITDYKLRTEVENPSILHLIVEGKLDQNDGTAKVMLYDWTLGKWKRVHTHAIGRSEQGQLILDLDASRFVKPSGLIRVRIRHQKVTSSNGDPFVSAIDQVEVLVR